MFYLFWTLLNCGLTILFCVVCYRAAKLLKDKLGAYDAIFFVIGLLSFTGCSNNHEASDPDTGQRHTWTFNQSPITPIPSLGNKPILLQDNLISKYFLAISYGKDNITKKYEPISAHSFTNGLTGSCTWVPAQVIINRSDDQRGLHYEVWGTVEWRVFGMAIYSESKKFEGVVKVS